MSESMPGGRRRIDRVLAADYLQGLESLDLDAVRGLRRDAVQEEADLSYIRRLLHGRMDVVRAELVRRASGDPGRLVDDLPGILSDERNGGGSHRYLSVEPSRAGEHRRDVEQVLGDIDLTDVTLRTEEELQAALDRLAEYEARLSSSRHAVQQVVDACNAEIARRYRDGEAHVGALLDDEMGG